MIIGDFLFLRAARWVQSAQLTHLKTFVFFAGSPSSWVAAAAPELLFIAALIFSCGGLPAASPAANNKRVNVCRCKLFEHFTLQIVFLIYLLVLISVKTGLYLGPCANVVVDLRVEIALHHILLVVPIVCACPAAWGIGNLH